MILSKLPFPLIKFSGKYLEELYCNPLRTKAITSCVIASLGNLTSQVLSGSKRINQDSIIAFGLFGLLFGGPVPHYFYLILEKVCPGSSKSAALLKFLVERFLYAPFYQFLSLYMLARFEGKDHDKAFGQAQKLYWPVLEANWKCLSIIQFVNITFVPSMLRVLVVNIIGFFWSIYLANKRNREEQKRVLNILLNLLHKELINKSCEDGGRVYSDKMGRIQKDE